MASWDDLPAELGEIILPKVPLLRLAQLAHLSKEFQAAYGQRMAAHVATTAPLRDVCIGPGHDSIARPQYEELKIRRCPLASHIPHFPNDPFIDWAYHGCIPTELPTCKVSQHERTCAYRVFNSLQAPLRVFGSFKVTATGLAPGTSLSLEANVKIDVVLGLTHRVAICKEFLLECSRMGACTGQDLAGWLMLCIAMAAPLRGFLDDVARGPPFDGQRSREACVIPSVVLVLPRESEWPNEVEEAAIWEALTCFLAIVGGKPSGARLALGRELTRKRLSKFECTKSLVRAVHGT
jgi:hypothetical protein